MFAQKLLPIPLFSENVLLLSGAFIVVNLDECSLLCRNIPSKCSVRLVIGGSFMFAEGENEALEVMSTSLT